MKKLSLILWLLLIVCGKVAAQQPVYFIDSVLLVNDPDYDDQILETDIDVVNVVKDKDTLRSLGFEKYEGVIFIFTKEYRNRSEEDKRLPTMEMLEKKDDGFYLRGVLYSGKFVDYYLSGRKRKEGVIKSGLVEGKVFEYGQGKQVLRECEYSEGVPHGESISYYSDGKIKERGAYIEGKEEGTWELYYPNGQLKQKSFNKEGVVDGEATIFYSNGNVKAVEHTRKGKTTPDPKLEKRMKLIGEGYQKSREGDVEGAIKLYTRAIAMDSTNEEAYMMRGYARTKRLAYEDAIKDFDKALMIEPYYEQALSGRAMARARKYKIIGGKPLLKNTVVMVTAEREMKVPDVDRQKICADVNQAIYLGDDRKENRELVNKICLGR